MDDEERIQTLERDLEELKAEVLRLRSLLLKLAKFGVRQGYKMTKGEYHDITDVFEQIVGDLQDTEFE